MDEKINKKTDGVLGFKLGLRIPAEAFIKSSDAGGNNRFIRLDLTDIAIRDKVLRTNNDDDLKNIFATDGKFE